MKDVYPDTRTHLACFTLNPDTIHKTELYPSALFHFGVLPITFNSVVEISQDTAYTIHAEYKLKLKYKRAINMLLYVLYCALCYAITEAYKKLPDMDVAMFPLINMILLVFVAFGMLFFILLIDAEQKKIGVSMRKEIKDKIIHRIYPINNELRNYGIEIMVEESPAISYLVSIYFILCVPTL
jgi:hypothetical protein